MLAKQRGGSRSGAGRPKGKLGSKTVVRKKAAELAIKAAMAEGETPLEYMLRVMRSTQDEKRRDAMAVAAAPYVHAKLAAVAHTGKDGDPLFPSRIEIKLVDAKR